MEKAPASTTPSSSSSSPLLYTVLKYEPSFIVAEGLGRRGCRSSDDVDSSLSLPLSLPLEPDDSSDDHGVTAGCTGSEACTAAGRESGGAGTALAAAAAGTAAVDTSGAVVVATSLAWPDVESATTAAAAVCGTSVPSTPAGAAVSSGAGVLSPAGWLSVSTAVALTRACCCFLRLCRRLRAFLRAAASSATHNAMVTTTVSHGRLVPTQGCEVPSCRRRSSSSSCSLTMAAAAAAAPPLELPLPVGIISRSFRSFASVSLANFLAACVAFFSFCLAQHV